MRDLQLAFDVGHSSIGWAVLQTVPELEIKGCGAVIFRADDCLASTRRGYRRQRRHIRSTRQRIKRMKALLAHLGVLTKDQLDKPGCAWPWKLAARVLVGGKTLAWPELWDVLRWYAHNRGYDANRRWSAGEVADEKEDKEKVQNAHTLMGEHGKPTMAETFCAVCGIDPIGAKCSSHIDPAKRFKAKNAAFPRNIVEAEVARILKAHFGNLRGMDERFATGMFSDWRAIPCPDIKLPLRYQGGLLFGQLVPRFDNRIISTCPITGQKVPSRNTPEFLNFRWGMLLANVRVARLADRELKPLTPEERRELDKRMREAGGMTESEFKKAVRDISGAIRDNLATMLMHPDARKALELDPVQECLTAERPISVKILFAALPTRIQKRVRGQLRRGKSFTFAALYEMAKQVGESVAAFDAAVQQLLDKAAGKGKKKDKPLTRDELLAKSLSVPKLSGRAAYARPILAKAFAEVMAGKHPAEDDGCLFVTERMRETQLTRTLAEQTNNHLVRHRLLILGRLLKDIIEEYAGDDKKRIGRMTIEVNRDLREMSGKTAKEVAQNLGLRMANFKSVVKTLEQDESFMRELNRRGLRHIPPGIIRKARVAEDLGWRCPYTGLEYEPIHLLTRSVDKDHIVPHADRASDSMDSLVITFSEVNKWKAKRTAYQFVADEQSKPVPGKPELSIKTLTQYKAFVEGLEVRGSHDDDKKRKKRRKDLLVLPSYEEKEFTPRDLTVTSQLVRLGAQTLKHEFMDLEEPPVTVSLPGAVTGNVRKAWDVLGCLSKACPQVLDAEGKVKTKTEIRDITHLHHALDACVLGLAAHFIPNNGRVWELITKRNLTPAEQKEMLALGVFVADAHGRVQLNDLKPERKEQIRKRLAEKSVVQHIPKRMNGLPTDLNMWILRGWDKKGKAILEKHSRDVTSGKRKKDKPKAGADNRLRLVGWEPEGGRGKLKELKAVLIANENFGVALDPEPIIIPFLKVGVQIYKGLNGQRSFIKRNGGKMPRILRSGQLVSMPKGTHKGDWRVFSIKNNANGVSLSLGERDALACDESKQNVLVRQLLKDGMTILDRSLTGVACSPVPAKLA
jgi:CRISPR-associated endonuclease Csn1